MRSRRRYVLVLGLACWTACSDSTTPPTSDTGTRDAGAHCATDADCTDGIYCNGVERCIADGGGDARGCAPPLTTPCAAGMTCSEISHQCTGSCAQPDADGDGHTSMQCGGDDCDDTDAHRFPGNVEVCLFDATSGMRLMPGHDEDCNAMTYANGMTRDGDHDVDGFVDAACENTDATGHVFGGRDCADVQPVAPAAPFTMPVPAAAVHPTQAEICNGVDDDCNGQIDDGLPQNRYYPDCDGDQFGDANSAGMLACAPGALTACNGHAWTLDHTDCDDGSNTAHVGAPELCNGINDDCDTMTDEAPAADADCTTQFPGTPHATVACSGTTHMCALTCAASFGDCNHVLADGCEVDLRTDATDCGSCGHACPPAATCSAMTCEQVGLVDAGAAFTCVLYATSGHAACWGENNEGQLGDGTTIDRPTPVAVAPPVGGVTQSFGTIDAGGRRQELEMGNLDQSHTCATTRAGDAIYCWGRGVEGQLGYSGTATHSAPTLAAGIPMASAGSTGTPTLVAVAAGATWTIGVQRDPLGMSQVEYQQWSWGEGATEIAGGGSTSYLTPMRAVATTSTTPPAIRSVSAGLDTTCYIVSATSAVYCTQASSAPAPYALPAGWTGAAQVATNGVVGAVSSGPLYYGGNVTCVLGPGPTGGPVSCTGSVPGLVPGLTDAVEIAVGGRFACARRATGAVMCWGDNERGELGNPAGGALPDMSHQWTNTPVAVVGITNAIQITAGGDHACALLADHSVWCWGANDHGQLGLGNNTEMTVPTAIPGTWKSLAIGTSHTCGVRSTDATLWCWGANARGQLGDGTLLERFSAVQVGIDTDWSAVTAGSAHTCALKTDGSLWCWGADDAGQLLDGQAWTSVPIAVP